MEDLVLQPGLTIPGNKMYFRSSRASGPGGQHVNKTDSRVTLYFDLENSVAFSPAQKARVRAILKTRIRRDGVLWLVCDSHRSQHANRREARDRLRNMLVEAIRPPKVRRKSNVSRSSKRKRLDTKHRRSDLKRTRGRVSES